MHDLLHAERHRLSEREAELAALIAAGETRCQEIAAAANAEIAAVSAEGTTHAEELIGVRHSIATLEALQASTPPSSAHDLASTHQAART